MTIKNNSADKDRMARELNQAKAALEQAKSDLELAKQQNAIDAEKSKHLQAKLEIAETESSSYKTQLLHKTE